MSAVIEPPPHAPVEVDKNDFRDTVLKNVSFESFGYQKADWDKIEAIK